MDKDKRGDVVSTTSPLFERCYDDEGLIMSAVPACRLLCIFIMWTIK